MAVKKAAKKPARKSSQPKPVASEKPLPPPVPVAGTSAQAGQSDPYNLAEVLSGNSSPASDMDAYSSQSGISSIDSEPAPGEPLNAEAERLLNDVPETIGNAAPAAGPGASAHDQAAVAVGMVDAAFLQSLISFDESDVRAVLEEGFDFLAEKFDSAHWKLSERQSRMLGAPTAQLLSTLWTKVSMMLPEQFAKWCSSTPGLAGFVLTASIVIGPKVAQQWSVTKKRRSLSPQPRRGAAPGPVPVARPQAGPVGPIDTAPIQPIPTDHSSE